MFVLRGFEIVAANFPAGEYEATTANSPLKQPVVGIPVKVELGDRRFGISVEPDVNYMGKFVVRSFFYSVLHNTHVLGSAFAGLFFFSTT